MYDFTAQMNLEDGQASLARAAARSEER